MYVDTVLYYAWISNCNIASCRPKIILIHVQAVGKLFFHAKRNETRRVEYFDNGINVHISSRSPNKGVFERVSRSLFSVLFLFMRPPYLGKKWDVLWNCFSGTLASPNYGCVRLNWRPISLDVFTVTVTKCMPGQNNFT